MTEPVLGRPNATPSDQIGTFRVEGPLDIVHFHSAVCPVTDQPDFYTIDIEYVPGSCCIETKSPKLYLQTFDNRGVFAEHLAEAVGVPVTVGLAQQVRGGLVTTVTATGTPS